MMLEYGLCKCDRCEEEFVSLRDVLCIKCAKELGVWPQ